MQIKCNSCGASQNISEGQNCGFCGSTIETEKAQENYKNSNTGEVGNLMMMAETAVEATNWEEALQYYNKILEKEISNSDAWLGKGIAIVYTSKIGEIKTAEAIAYWKNAIKHTKNSEAMGKRVAKEINTVVNSFYPTIENHYKKFHNLDDSYQELVSRFGVLENAQDFATQLDPENIVFYETGYNLCKKVIELPKKYASAASNIAFAEGVAGQFSSNKYSRQSAARNSREKMAESNRRLEEISRASKIIEKIRQKYVSSIEKIDPNHICIKDLDREIKNKVIAKEEAVKTNNQTYATIIIMGILYSIILSLDLQINPILLFIIVFIISMILGIKIVESFYEKSKK